MASAAKTQTDDVAVTLELNPGSGVDVLGDCDPPLLWVGLQRGFTKAEAKQLLALVNEHGTPICRTVVGDSES